MKEFPVKQKHIYERIHLAKAQTYMYMYMVDVACSTKMYGISELSWNASVKEFAPLRNVTIGVCLLASPALSCDASLMNQNDEIESINTRGAKHVGRNQRKLSLVTALVAGISARNGIIRHDKRRRGTCFVSVSSLCNSAKLLRSESSSYLTLSAFLLFADASLCERSLPRSLHLVSMATDCVLRHQLPQPTSGREGDRGTLRRHHQAPHADAHPRE